METIEEQQSKSGEMSISPSPENLRICLVGNVVDDKATVDAAQSFGVPVVTSEIGLEILTDCEWKTYFILKEFDGPVYDAIHKSKHRLMGPPALIQAAEMKQGLVHCARPIYNYSMRGVVTCFTGIRKKDELTKLVNLIHSMGGCIRKDMNSKITHLICNSTGGDKYQYAKTFRLTVVHSAWVYEAWKRRDELEFMATNDEFSKEHKLKVFEGQKICFFGFPPDEHQHMLDVLQSNGGVPAELDDAECSHVVMANTGGYFPETISSSSPKSSPLLANKSGESGEIEFEERMNVDNDLDGVCYGDDNVAPLLEDDEMLTTSPKNATCSMRPTSMTSIFQSPGKADDADVDMVVDDDEIRTPPPKNATSSTLQSERNCNTIQKPDGIVLTMGEENAFQNVNNISPILSTPRPTEISGAHQHFASSLERSISPIDNVGGGDDDNDKDLKRKRDISFDSVSIMSFDSFALPSSVSAKKPKLIRTGSITRSIKRSISFVGVKTPIAKMLRQRRSSVDPDASICSITSLESTFNESIKKPVKEKLRSIRDRITRSKSNSNSDNCITMPKQKSAGIFSAFAKTPEKQTTNDDIDSQVEQTQQTVDFKTPKAPGKSSHITSHTPIQQSHHYPSSLNSSFYASSSTRFPVASSTSRHSLSGVSSSAATITSSTCETTSNFNLSAATTNIRNCNQESIASPQQIIAPPAQIPINIASIAAAANAATPSNSQIPNRNVNECDDVSMCPIDGGRFTVVDEHLAQAKPEPKNSRTHILKSDWFWYTIQNGYADEMDYLFGDYLDSIANTPSTDRRESLPISFNKRKRKRFSQRIQLEGTPIGSGKRRSSVSDAGLLSVSGSFFDCTVSPDKLLESGGKLMSEPESAVEQTPVKNKSMRFNHFMDFFSTESNYVGILDTIVNLFKNPLEEIAESSDALLNKSEIKAIFGNFIPIHEVHQRMLECLQQIHSKWQEDCFIGEIILQHRDELIKAYPPYVNFFEQMKETLQHCDTQNPRFHAFLKINQTKPECGRQTLQDLMIRPVQRLPSISLLLNDILKHTNKNNADYQKLEEALKAIKEVMAHINEDKRKTESRMAIFDIFNDIEGCPAHLVSSNRSLISKCEVTELSDNLSGRGDSLMLYLFSDTIEVCKKRSRGFNSAKSPSTTKSLKHIKLMSLNAIRFVIDITDSPRAFAMLCRQDKDKLHSFTIADEEIDKVLYLKTLCKQMAENACRTDTDKSLIFRTSQELEVDISDVNLSTLSKAFKLAARTRMKVGRAFSFNKTPSKLKRAVSTMMTSPFGSTNSLTPSSQLAQMRLASCTNIHEVTGEESSRCGSPSSQTEVLVAPLSVQPTRKNKSSAMSMAGLRRI